MWPALRGEHGKNTTHPPKFPREEPAAVTPEPVREALLSFELLSVPQLPILSGILRVAVVAGIRQKAIKGDQYKNLIKIKPDPAGLSYNISSRFSR